MVNPVSAQIIAFPVRPLPEPEVADCQIDRSALQDSLSTALAALANALAEQQIAIRRWRNAIDELAGSMRTLSGGLERLDQVHRRAPVDAVPRDL